VPHDRRHSGETEGFKKIRKMQKLQAKVAKAEKALKKSEKSLEADGALRVGTAGEVGNFLGTPNRGLVGTEDSWNW
jgi:hypothetical protein